jgi:hypothetical protein
MVKALEAHERKHHDIQVDCADDLEKQIKAAKTLDAKALNKMISDQQKALPKEAGRLRHKQWARREGRG